MTDPNINLSAQTGPIKAAGLNAARSIQIVFETVCMFGGDHASAAVLINRAYGNVTAMVKQHGSFKLGFVDGRLMINNILIKDESLSFLHKEFGQRRVSAMVFEKGLALPAFRRAIDVVSTPSTLIELAGGIETHLKQNPLEKVKVVHASKAPAV